MVIMKDLHHFKKIALLTLALFFLNPLFNPLYNQASAASFLSSYQILKQDYSDVIDRIVAGGATEADIEAFLLDLESTVSSKGTLTKDNFNSIMYKSFEEVIQYLMAPPYPLMTKIPSPPGLASL